MEAALSVAERFRIALDLFETGLRLRREALRRSNPDASEAQIDDLLTRWLQERPGAEAGDGPSQPPR